MKMICHFQIYTQHMFTKIRKFLMVPIWTVTFFIACRETGKEPPKENLNEKAGIKIQVFRNDTTGDSSLGGYGYTIFMQNARYIHQPNIPAVNGNRGFSSAENAEKTGELTAYKIRNNIMPPSITVKELDSLGVLK